MSTPVEGPPVRNRGKLARTLELLNEEIVLQRFVKAFTTLAFRNHLEPLHRGITPSSKSGDGEDIVVTSPYGTIPWNNLSRFSDKEIAEINKLAAHSVYCSFKAMLAGDFVEHLEDLRSFDPHPNWDAPNVRPKKVKKAKKHA